MLDAYEQIVGPDLGTVAVDGCITKAPCGGEAAGKSPVDRGKQGTKRSLLRPTLEKLGRFGFDLPEHITVHVDAGYDSAKTRDLLAELGCDAVMARAYCSSTGTEGAGEEANAAMAT